MKQHIAVVHIELCVYNHCISVLLLFNVFYYLYQARYRNLLCVNNVDCCSVRFVAIAAATMTTVVIVFIGERVGLIFRILHIVASGLWSQFRRYFHNHLRTQNVQYDLS